MNNNYDSFIKFHRITCEDDVKSMKDLLEGSTILDIGSNLGLFSSAIIDKCKYKKIYMFEPVKEFFDFSKNMLKDRKKIVFNNFALGDVDAEMEISINLDMNIGTSSLVRSHTNEIKQTVSIKTLDSLNIKDKIDFIKIDVEGFDPNVILGGMKTIEKNMPVIFTEISYPLTNDQKQIYKDLFNLGYQSFNLDHKEYNVVDILILPLDFKREQKLSDVTFVLTSCGRMDLLEKTLDSFFKYNTYPIDRYLIIEDSTNTDVFERCKSLNIEKYNNKLEFIFNHEKLGQSASIDKAYSNVETEYIFHCEDDWEFYQGGFIEDSIKVLKTQPKVIQSWIRPKSDGILNKIQNKINSLPLGVCVRIVEPTSFIVKNANIDGSDIVVTDFMGFSWNPGVKRLKDWEELPNGYAGFEREHLVDQYYRSRGFMVVSLSKNDEEGYVKHIGWNRRAADHVYRNQKIGISVIMISYLGKYEGSRSAADKKFIRAVESFKKQTHNVKELIIVSDGCEITNEIYFKKWKNDPEIHLVRCEKSEAKWPGALREVGRSIAKYEWIHYLDTDDYDMPNHLGCIAESISTREPNTTVLLNSRYYFPLPEKPHDLMLVYCNVTLKKYKEFRDSISEYDGHKLASAKSRGHNGTWQIVHHKNVPHRWENSETIGEDKNFIERLKSTEKWIEFKGHHIHSHFYNTDHNVTLWEI